MKSLPPAVLLAVMACASGNPAADEPQTNPGEPFRLAVGEAADLPDEELTVSFVGVKADSRCPSDAHCIWAGDAEVEVRVRRGEEETTVSLHTHGGDRYPKEAQAFGHTLSLEAVDPYPKSADKISPEDYVATLKVAAGESQE